MRVYNINEVNIINKLIPDLKKITSRINSNDQVTVKELESILMRISYFEGGGIEEIDENCKIIRDYYNKKYK